MAKLNSERLAEARKRRGESKGSTSSSGSKKTYRNSEKLEKLRLEREIGLDTFEEDIKEVGATINTVYSGWQTAETLNNTKTSIQSMQNRVSKYEQYRSKYGTGKETDLSDTLKAYDDVLGDFDNLSSVYGQYKNADAYGKAKKKAELDYKFAKKDKDGNLIGGLTFEEVQAELKKYEEGSDEHTYLKGYTGYTNLNDFDKAIAWEKGRYTNVKGEKANTEDKFKIHPTDEEENATLQLQGKTQGKKNLLDISDAFPKSPTGKLVIPEEANLDVAKKKRDKIASDFVANNEYVESLEREKNKRKLDHGVNDYYAHHKENEDFEKLSQYTPSELEGLWDKLTDGSYGLGYGDVTYEYINDVDGARSKIKDAKSKFGSDTKSQTTSQEKKGYDKLNPEEVQIYNYLYAKHGKESAQQYLDSMEVALSKRVYDEATQSWKDATGGVLSNTAMSLLSIPENIIGGFTGAVSTLGDALQGKEYNPYGYYKNPSNFASDVREYVGEDIANATEGMDVLGVNVPSFLYQTGMSMGDTVLGVGTLGMGYTAVAGSSAFQQKAKELKEQGENDSIVYTGALASGTAEMVFEYIGIDNLFKLKSADSIGMAVKNALKQAGAEGFEEVGTEISNILSDTLIRGGNSELMQKYNDMIARGYTDKEASIEIAKQIGSQVAQAGIGGALSGFGLGGVSSLGNYSANKSTGASIRENAQTDSAWDMSAMTPEESETYKLYTEYANKGVNAGNITDAQLGNLYNTAEAESYEALNSKKSKDVDRLNAVTTLDKLDKISKPNTEEFRKQRVESLNKGEVTEVTATGNSAKIEGIKKVDGDIVVATTEGEFKADEVTFSQNDAELLSYAENMSEDMANLFVSQYDGSASVDAYNDSFNLAVSYAENNISHDTMLENRGVLTPSQVSTIYTSIVTNKSKAQRNAITKLMEKHGNAMSYKGTINDSVIDYDSKTTDGSKVNWNSLTDSQRKGVTFLTGLAKATGLDAELVTDGLERGFNGAYMVENGKIVIDVYAGVNKLNMAEDSKDTIIPALSHEITHWSKAKSPEKYQSLSEDIFKVLAKGGKGEAQLIDEEILRLRKNGIKADVEYARDEIIARACEDMLAMSETGKEMFNGLSESERKSLLDKVKDIINDFVNWVNELLTHYESKSKEATYLRQYKEDLLEISKKWDAMFKESIEVNQAMKKEGITDKELQTNKSTTQLSDREFANAIEQWSKEGLPSGDVFVLGTTGDVLQGLGAIESDIYMNGDKIKTILDDHEEITIDEIKKIPRILDNPVMVLKSKSGNSRLVMFGSVKAKNGKPMLVVLDLRPRENGFLLNDMQKVNSAYTKTETHNKTAEENGMEFVKSSEVLYLDKKRTTYLLSAIGFYMPITCNQSGYIGNISYAGEHVKLQGEAFSNVITLNTSTTQLSDRDSEYQSLYDNVQEYRKEYRTAQEELKKYKVPDINFDAEDMDAEIEKVNKWQEESGYLKASKKSENVYDKLRDAERKLQNLADELRNEMYTDFTEEDVKKYVSKAVRRYHTTSLLSRASYLTTTGSMLDFSDGQGYRVKDHREISEILDLPDYAEYSDGMITFMNMGNIRLQSYGVDISTMPNTKQMSALRSIIYKLMNDNGEFYLDVSDYRGNNVFSMTYGEKTSVSKIVADIKNYFDKGTIPEQQSSIAGFYYSDRDSDGNVLSRAQQEYFKSSQVRDDNGNLLVVYHGTRKADFTVFNRTHTYFTDSKDMADSYSPNGEGYKGYLNITNPFVVDAMGEKWSKVPIDVKTKAFLQEHSAGVFKEKGKWRTTPADIVYAIEDAIEEGTADYDGVIIKNVDDTGSHGNKQGIVSNDYIAFNSNQFKNVDNLNPTKDRDIRYSDRDSEGTQLTNEQVEYFKNSKIRDENGNLLVMYHGTQSDFTVFNPFIQGGKNGTAEGYGNYFTDSTEVSEVYGKQMKGYVNVTHPATAFGKTIKRVELEKLLKATCENEAKKMVEDDGYASVDEAIKDTWISNYEYTYDKTMSQVYRNVAQNIISMNEHDMDIIQEVMVGQGINNYERAYAFYDILKSTLGIDGFVTEWENPNISSGKSRIVVAFYSNQFKNADNTNPTKNEDIRYSDRYAPTFYSHMGRVVDDIKQDKIGANSVVSYLKGRGVKDEEIKWSGIETFLEGKKSVTKAELQEFVAGSMLQIDEEYVGNQNFIDFEKELKKHNIDLEDYQNWDDSINFEALMETLDNYYSDGDMDLDTVIDLMHTANILKYEDGTKWHQYKIDGGRNYRELLFKMPNSPYTNNAMKTHWGREGVLAHARIQDVMTKDGKKMLFIEEIQSDWHNEGHKHGYTNDVRIFKLKHLYNQMGEALRDFGDAKHMERAISLREEYTNLENELHADGISGKSIPDAPFRNNYHEFVLKRLLRMASEEGYDAIGWTPADIQEDRWSSDYAEGYRIEYDQDIPKFLRKYGKKWGATVGQSTTTSGYDVWSMDITDAMKQSVLYEGQTMYSDRIDDSVYDVMGENEALKKLNKILTEDVKRLRERVRLEGTVTNGKVFDANQLHSVAVYLNKTVNSAYNSKQLAKDLERLYSYIAQSKDIDEHSLFAKCQEIARNILAEQRGEKVVDDYYKGILDDLRSRRISLSEEQIKEVQSQYGDRYRNAFMGKIMIAKDGISLDSVWQELSQMYPEVFDAETTEADQPLVLLEIYDSARESSVIYQKYMDAETTMSLATEIYNKYWTAPRVTTVADKYTAEIKKLNFEHRKAMSDLRTDFNDRLQKQKTADAIHYGKIINDLRHREQSRVKEAKEFGRRRVNEVRDRAERNAKIRSITDKALTLNKWLLKNSKDEHIAEPLKKPVAYLLDAIDFSSKQLLGMRGDYKAHTPTQRDISLSQALEEVHEMARGIESAQIGEDDISAVYGTFADFPVGFADDVRSLSKEVNNIMRTVGDNEFVLNQMSLDSLKELDKIITTIKSTVTQMNKFLAVRHAQGVANLSQNDILYLDSLGKGKVEGRAKKMLNWGNALPYYAFKRFGKGGQKVYEALMDGWDKFSFHTKKIIDYAESVYTADEIKKWETDIKTFDVLEPTNDADLDDPNYKPTYQKIQMTVPQIMSLYCLQKREQAKDHLKGGGIRIADIEVKQGAKKNVISQSEGVIFAESEIETIINSLTDRQREVADKLQEFMNTVCTDWGNEVSMLRFGYKAFGEENYFPIQSDKNNLAVNDETENNNSLFRLLNMSFTKSTIKKANNRIVISNIFDVFAQHTSDMAKYNALALPVLDSFKWYNYKEKIKQGETQHKTKSLKQSLENAYGKNAQNYITTFLRDINGSENSSRDTVGKHFFTNAKIASVGMNLRVALLQPTSYLRASAVIDTKYLIRAMGHKPKIARAEKYCGIAQWKALGFYDTNIQRGVTELIKHSETVKDKAVEVSMKGAEWGDKVTWGYLWNACELEIRDTRKDLKVGSNEFNNAIGKRLREIIYATQVVDSTMTRSQMMRSSDMYDKMLTSFASEPTLAYNMMQDASWEIKLAKRRGESRADMKKHKSHFLRVATAYTVTNIMCALIESGFDAFRDDEEEEMDLATFMKMYLSNFATDMSFTAKVPYIKEGVSILQGYSSSRTDTQWMQSFGYALTGIKKLMEGKGDAYKTFKHLIRGLSYVSGLPFYNLWRDSMSLLNKSDILTAEELNETFNDAFGIEE